MKGLFASLAMLCALCVALPARWLERRYGWR